MWEKISCIQNFAITNQLAKDGKSGLRADADIVDFATLTRFEQLGGKGCATKVRVGADDEAFRVFKGIDFRTFLTYCGSDEDESDDNAIKLLIENWYHTIGIMSDMPPHPNIISSPTTFVVIKDPNIGDCDTPVVCGWLYPFLSKGDVGALIEASNKVRERIPLRLKAQWCAQMTSAIKHTHLVAHTYHMDIKPGNFLIDDDDNLLLIDWEQSDAPATTLAPEADGTWDVREVSYHTDKSSSSSSSTGSTLEYTKYEGPERSNMNEDLDWGRTWNVWNVFPLWNLKYPRALQLAEVFSLGRTMWMLLCQPDMEFDDVEHPTDLVTDWGGRGGGEGGIGDTDDVLAAWKEMVDRCMAMDDPNQRPDLTALNEFWERVTASSSDFA